MKHSILIKNLTEIEKAAKEFVDYISDSDIQSNIFAFEAPMGAGKTTFIKAICSVLGAGDVVYSPTFTIINEYRAAKGFPIFHFDFYRINKLSEAYVIGIEEYFASDGLCLMEWPEKIKEILPEETVYVKIVINQDDSRSVIIER